MLGTRIGDRVETMYNGLNCVTNGARNNNMTVQKHYQVEYPKDIQIMDWDVLIEYAGIDAIEQIHPVYLAWWL